MMSQSDFKIHALQQTIQKDSDEINNLKSLRDSATKELASEEIKNKQQISQLVAKAKKELED